MTRIAFTLALGLLLVGCSDSDVPPCPYTGTPDFAPSAGCLAVIHGKVLVVDSRRGGLSPPGGKSINGESAQCTAHRETFEETGLDLIPRDLVHVFDTGFHLYYCEIHAGSGLLTPEAMEVRRGFWLSVDEFDSVTWRYEGQGEALREILSPQERSEAPETGQ